ncbi:MAG TPA: outer membrane beta-barrel protein [Gemmatimonadales bacterium]|nr:outer membrane beta-barrel protein [Gemmatimonadales bacterium]
MKTLMRGAAVGLALALSAQVAQAQGGLSFGLGAGVVVPSGSMADLNSTGYTGQASLRMQPAASPLGFQVDGFYTRLGLQDDIAGHSQMIGGTANAVYAFSGASAARPYLIGGLGVYNTKLTLDGFGSGSDTKFGANAGAGFDFKLGAASLYAEGRFHTIFKAAVDAETLQETTAYMIPITVGLRF